MKKIIAWLLVLAMTAAISIGATLAYLTDTDEDVNVMTIGNVKIDQLEYERVDDETKNEDATVQEFHDNKPLYPGVYEDGFDFGTGDAKVDWTQIGKDGYTSEIWNPENINNELDKMVFVKNKGNYDAYVRTVFAFEAGNYENLDEFKAKMHLNLNETDWSWEWIEDPVAIPNEKGGETSTKYFIAVATYNKKLAPGAITEISLSQIALDKSATNADVEAFGDTYQILVKTQAIQADGFESAAIALDEGFEPINEENIPWESDTPTKGGTLNAALHYLNADPTGTPITTSVTNIVFGKNAEYPQIVNNEKGYLVDVEQDIPAYAYYMDNSQVTKATTGYTVYILSNDVIYTPEDSNNLFYGMSKLSGVDTGNLSTSRTTDMSYMFGKCSALVDVDVSNWDLSKCTTLKRTFYACTKLPQLDVSNWNTANVTSLNGTFFNCQKLQDINANGWDTSNVTDLYATFYNCLAMRNLDLSNWNTSNVTAFDFTFSDTKYLDTLNIDGWDFSNGVTFDSFMQNVAYSNPNTQITCWDLNHWDLSNAVNLSHFFYGQRYLKELHIDQWELPKVVNADHMFSDCVSLTELDLSGWKPVSLEVLDCMFNDLDSLVTIDVSCFAVSPMKNLSQTFESMNSLEKIIGLETWDVSQVFTCQQMFQGSGKLKELDLSTWDTSSVKETVVMFNGCSSLKTIYVGDKWDMSACTWSDNMFSGCGSLTGANGTTTAGNPTDVTYARVDTAETPGYLTYKAN